MRRKNSIKAAGYYRLSRDDGDKLESDSIANQRTLVTEFAEKNDIHILESYIDDGFSGTNFERPDFMRLMDDIRDGKINCIIVKDLSRLGRNYIEMGKYMTRIFPSLGVRLISINDNYDSLNDEEVSNQIVVPFKNLINDAYCRDISIKVRSQLDIKRKNGQFIGSFAPFGYKKDVENHNHLVIDETAAEIVQLIFSLKLDGYNSLRITQKLDEMGIPTPRQYKQMHYSTYTSGFKAKPNSGWSEGSVNRILRDETYTGTLVQGKRRKINYKVKQSVDMPEKDWIRVEDSHEAIIPKYTFDRVQRLLSTDMRTAPDQESVYALSGKIKCAGCGCNMIRRSTESKGRKYYYYHCSTKRYYGVCKSHNISEKIVKDTVLLNLQKLIRALSDYDGLLEKINNIPNDKISIKVIENQIKSQRKEVERYGELKVKLYQDMCDSVITKDEFKQLNDVFTDKIDALEESISANNAKIQKLNLFDAKKIPWVKSIMESKNLDDLDNRVVTSMVDSIMVFDKDKIEIRYTYGECFDDIVSFLKDLEVEAV